MHPTMRDLGTIYKLLNPAGEGILSATPTSGTVCQMAVSAPNPQGFYTLSVKNLLQGHTFTITGCSTVPRSDGSEGLSPASLKVAPNPVTDQVRLHFPVLEGSQPTPSRVQLYQLDGKIVLDQEVTPDDQGNVDIYLEHIKSGFYVIRVQNVKGLFTQKISKVD
jgi:hypothetical protein